MSCRKDYKNQVFGEAKVISFVGVKNTHAVWKCKCLKCGIFFNATASNLKSGNTKGCNNCKILALKSRKKLSEKEESEIYKYHSSGVSMRTLASSYDVGLTTIFNILKRKKDHQ